MVYKKYIKKHGKIYGPYTYYSQRVDGKVVSNYLGKKKPVDYKNFLWIFIAVISIIILIYFASYIFEKPFSIFSGKAVLNLETTYYENESLEGVLRLSLKEGELLPASSKIIIQTSSKVYEYNLEDLVSEAEETVDGDFYVEGKGISGGGQGYGVAGSKEVYPVVYFTLDISKQTVSGEIPKEEEVVEEEINETLEEEIPEEEVVEEEINETLEEEIPEETGSVVEETPEQVEKEEFEEVIEVIEETETITEETVPEEESEQAPITGGFIFRTFAGVLDFLRPRPPTGQVILEVEEQVEGQVSKNELFSHDLIEGQTASLKLGSVKTDSKSLFDDDVDLEIKDNIISVTTDYSEKGEEGFGEEYLGEIAKEISIDLSDLNVIAERGELKISVSYANEEIVFLDTILDVEGEISIGVNETIPQEINETVNITEVNITENITIEIEGISLTEKEKEILLKEFGNFSINTTKAEIFNNRLIVRYELKDYWIEYSYDSTDVEALKDQMEMDMIKWLKDLASRLSEKEKESEKVEELIQEHPI